MKYLTLVDNINTFTLKNHHVLKLKFLSIKQLLKGGGGSYRTPLGLLRLKDFKVQSMELRG